MGWVTLDDDQRVFIGPRGQFMPHGPGSRPVYTKGQHAERTARARELLAQRAASKEHPAHAAVRELVPPEHHAQYGVGPGASNIHPAIALRDRHQTEKSFVQATKSEIMGMKTPTGKVRPGTEARVTEAENRLAQAQDSLRRTEEVLGRHGIEHTPAPESLFRAPMTKAALLAAQARNRGEKSASNHSTMAPAEHAPEAKAIAEPWKMSPEEYQGKKGVHAPWIAEISPHQYGSMSKRQQAEYDKKRAGEWQASADVKGEWQHKVRQAHLGGQIDRDTPGLHPDAKRVIVQEAIRAKELRKKSKRLMVEERRAIRSPSEVKTGQTIETTMYGKVTVGKVNRATVQVQGKFGSVSLPLREGGPAYAKRTETPGRAEALVMSKRLHRQAVKDYAKNPKLAEHGFKMAKEYETKAKESPTRPRDYQVFSPAKVTAEKGDRAARLANAREGLEVRAINRAYAIAKERGIETRQQKRGSEYRNLQADVLRKGRAALRRATPDAAKRIGAQNKLAESRLPERFPLFLKNPAMAKPSLKEQAATHRAKAGFAPEVRQSTAEILRDYRKGKTTYYTSHAGGGYGSKATREDIGKGIMEEHKAKVARVLAGSRTANHPALDATKHAPQSTAKGDRLERARDIMRKASARARAHEETARSEEKTPGFSHNYSSFGGKLTKKQLAAAAEARATAATARRKAERIRERTGSETLLGKLNSQYNRSQFGKGT